MPAVHKSPTEKKRLLIQTVVKAMRAAAPWLLKECADAIKEMYDNEFDQKTGKLRAEALGRVKDTGYIKIRVPQHLFFALRKFWPDFGDDSDDLRLLAEEFPQLCFDRRQKKRHGPLIVK